MDKEWDTGVWRPPSDNNSYFDKVNASREQQIRDETTRYVKAEAEKVIHNLVSGKDAEIAKLREKIDKSDSEAYLLDRLLLGAVIEARGEERFNLLAKDLADQSLRSFYTKISSSEARHFALFLNLATKYFNQKRVEERLSEWIEIEKQVLESLPITSSLH